MDKLSWGYEICFESLVEQVRMQVWVPVPRHENAMTLLRIKRTQCPPMRPLSHAAELPALVWPKRLCVSGRCIVNAGEAWRAVRQTRPSAPAAGDPHLPDDDPERSISILRKKTRGRLVLCLVWVCAC